MHLLLWIDLQAWLEIKNIGFEDDMIKAELLQLVKENRPIENNYVVDGSCTRFWRFMWNL